MESEIVIRALGALAQEHRLALFRLLSFHLAQLTNAGLIAQRRDGRSLIYSADYGAMTALVGFLTENCCGGGAVCAPAAACATEIQTERKSA